MEKSSAMWCAYRNSSARDRRGHRTPAGELRNPDHGKIKVRRAGEPRTARDYRRRGHGVDVPSAPCSGDLRSTCIPLRLDAECSERVANSVTCATPARPHHWTSESGDINGAIAGYTQLLADRHRPSAINNT